MGALVDFGISEAFHIQPELLYVNISDSNALFLPIMAKFYVVDKFNLQAGPQFTISLEDSITDFARVTFDLGLGAGYDIIENFFVQARYSFQVTNSYTGDLDIKARVNYFNIGVGYKF